ncbi:MAG: Crp/Fnr family transcriptional regulator [Deltaproteobacteria bacterium]|nr:Crp/Fnr family transcriptional regulator [Deltaproteobacteria bacterium]
MNIPPAFKNAELFKDMSDEMLSMVARHAAMKTYNRGDILFTEGSTGTCFYLLARGGIRLYKTSFDGREITIRIILPTEVFAEVILFENKHYPVGAVAVSPSSAFEIPRDFFLSLLDNASFRNEFIRLLMHKQRLLTERILYLTSYDVEERFFRFIIERYGRKKLYDLDISKKEIASAIGTIPETLSRLILRLKKQGALTWEGKLLEIEEGYLEDFD